MSYVPEETKNKTTGRPWRPLGIMTPHAEQFSFTLSSLTQSRKENIMIFLARLSFPASLSFWNPIYLSYPSEYERNCAQPTTTAWAQLLSRKLNVDSELGTRKTSYWTRSSYIATNTSLNSKFSLQDLCINIYRSLIQLLEYALIDGTQIRQKQLTDYDVF